MKTLQLSLISLAVLLLAACQPDLSSDSYDYYGGMSASVRQGVIQDIQYNVNVKKESGVGTLAGAIAGGAAGQSAGGRGAGGVAGTVGGVVIGGIVGGAIEKGVGSTTATLYIIKLKSDRLVSVIQKSKLPLCKGDHVYLIGSPDRPRLKLNDSYYSDGEHSRTGCIPQHT